MSLNYDNEIPKKRNIDEYGVKKADRKYKPNFPKDMPKLPSIEEFKLDRIICDDLKEESQEVVDSMIKVASSYQNDLKSEIRRKLSIEQKIQFKNIEIAKIAHSLKKNITLRNKKLRRAISNNGGNANSVHNNSTSLLLLGTESTIDDEIEMLLELSAKASGKIRGLTQRLSKIDHRVNKMKSDEILGQSNSRRKQEYPYIHKMLVGKERKSDIKIASTDNKVPGEALAEREPMRFPAKPDVRSKEQPSIQDAKNEPNTHATLIVEDEEMNAEQFELFMSSSINKYRDLQLNKYSDLDIFMNPTHDKNYELINNGFFNENNRTTIDPSVSLSTFKPGNPLSLLYSSIIKDPKSNDQRLAVRPSLGNMTMNVKSPATVKPTLQTSHFKKLRINGSPITSETFLKMKERPTCECNNHEDDDHLSHFSDKSEDSIAKRALTDSLVALENFHMSSDDTSGLNTEPEDNDLESEPAITSESSDFDSLSSESSDNKTNMYAEQYYSLLKADLKKKKKKKLHLERTQQIHKRRMYQRKSMSPTPKHKPSHHSLKPKRSILKLPPTMKVRSNSHVPSFAKIRKTDAVKSNTKNDHYVLNTPEIKNINIDARPTVGSNSINDFTVTGTMLLARPNSGESSSNDNDENEVILWNGLPQEPHDDNADVMSLKSISRLKGFL